MKAYTITTGVIFALIAAAHVWRVVAERPRLVQDAGFMLLTAGSVALAVWAWFLVKKH